ncbi:hypothetical protein [Streptomyces albogriseolus]|uniref:hypothetical protein n=1 Tax=Streptomyces albogriseolus TaxID=1887 RepID=UPI003CEBC5F4
MSTAQTMARELLAGWAEGWLFRVSVAAWQNTAEGAVEPAWYTVWVHAPAHVKRVEGASYDDVPTTYLKTPPSRAVGDVLGPRRPTGWVLEAGRPRVRPQRPARPGL